jgi:hypothetical protein
VSECNYKVNINITEMMYVSKKCYEYSDYTMQQKHRKEDCMNFDKFTVLVIPICLKKIVIYYLYFFKRLTRYAEAKITNYYPYGSV